METQKFSVNGAIKFGWQTMKRHFWFFIAVIVISILVKMIPDAIAGIFEEDVPILSMVINIASWVISIIVEMGLFKIALKFCDDEHVVISDLFSCTPLFIKYILGAILYGLIVLAGMILLIIPGIIWAVKLQYFSYFIIDKKLGPIEALKESSRITTEIKWDVFVFCLVLIVINLVGFLCCILGLFVTIPMTMVAYAFVYRTLQDPEYAARTEFAQIPTSSSIIWVAIVVVLGFFGIILLGIIGAIAIPSFLEYRKRVHQTDIVTELKKLKVAEDAYFAKYNKYSSNLKDLNYAPLTSGVTVEIISADETCFEASGTHGAGSEPISIDCNGLKQYSN